MSSKKKKSLKQWCNESLKTDLLAEWNGDKNSNLRFPLFPDKIEYCTPDRAWWKCSSGHEWFTSVKKRTVFELGCPICNPEQTYIPIGTKYGCLTICGVVPVDESDYYKRINGPTYRCVCACGKNVDKSEVEFLKRKHRYCTEGFRVNRKDRWTYDEKIRENQCGLKTIQEEKKKATYKRVFDSSYDWELTGTIHESLEILECIDEHYEELRYITDLRKNGGGTYYIYKLYKCRCYLCGKEQQIKSSKFSINPPTEYGYTAYKGYWSDAHCDCHPISSFQWIVTKLLKESKTPYRVEISFPDLYGAGKVNQLRYDFGVYDENDTLKCLIECQGEQHYIPVDEFGGESKFGLQKQNDELKRSYAAEHKIPLYEIPFKNKKFEKIEEFLRLNNIIQ